MNFPAKLIFIILFSFIAFSCKKEVKYPDIPFIEFKSFQWIDSNLPSGILNIGFTDGTGDIGSDSDTTSNLYVYLYQKQNGKYTDTLIDCDNKKITVNYNANIKEITVTGKNKSIKGDIMYKIVFNFPDCFQKPDVIAFKIFLLDRQKNKSNEIFTPDIFLP